MSLSEEFRIWLTSSDCKFAFAGMEWDHPEILSAWEAWQASREALVRLVPNHVAGERKMVVAEGWQPVPVEPNYAMLSADGCKEHAEGQKCLHHDNRRRIWAAMLAAAPKPE